MLAPIVVFTYNRKDHTEKILNALSECELIEDTQVFVYSDAPNNERAVDKVNEVREFLSTFNKIKNLQVIKQEKNKGCNKSIRDGITEKIKINGRIIVVEDDIYVCKSFLKYLNSALDFYKDNSKVFSITGYNPVSLVDNAPYDTFLGERFSCWGWATWQDRWDNVNWIPSETIPKLDRKRYKKNSPDLIDGLYEARPNVVINNTWDCLVYFHMFANKMRSVYPVISHSDNIGLDGSGERSKKDNEYSNKNFNQNYLLEGSYNFGSNDLPKSTYDKFINQYVSNTIELRFKNFLKKILRITHTYNFVRKRFK